MGTAALLALALASAAGAAAAVGLARPVAVRVGLVDRPDGRRKLQARPVAVCGGLGAFAAALLGLAAAAALSPGVADALAWQPARGLGLLAGAVAMAAVGLLDDIVDLRPRHKLLGQAAAALVVIVPGGCVVERLSVFGVAFELGVLAVPLTLLGFVAAINALNLLDGMDGLLGVVGVLALATLAALALGRGDGFAACVALAAAGALLGFLAFNLPPATAYLGDCGSLLLGLVVAALAIDTGRRGDAVAPLGLAALLALPLLDTAAAVVRRKLTGRGVAEPDLGHFHHGLLRRYAGPWPALAAAALLGLIGAAGALAGAATGGDLPPLAAGAAVLAVLAATGWFGGVEVRLVAAKLRGLLAPTPPPPVPVVTLLKSPPRSRRGARRVARH